MKIDLEGALDEAQVEKGEDYCWNLKLSAYWEEVNITLDSETLRKLYYSLQEYRKELELND